MTEDVSWDGYDPMVAPDPVAWQELNELDAIDLVTVYHEEENQIAIGQEIPVAATLIRLQNEGLDRHDALHALAWVLVDHMPSLLSDGGLPEDPNTMYYKELEQLTAERWRRSAD